MPLDSVPHRQLLEEFRTLLGSGTISEEKKPNRSYYRLAGSTNDFLL